MFKSQIIFAALIALVCAGPHRLSSDVDTKAPAPPAYNPAPHELEQNKAAKYSFATNIEDHINDQTQQRTETRDGLKVEGSYSYSDGYVMRTVHYEADDKGFRVVKEEVQELEGPIVDLSGTALVSSNAHGQQLQYNIQSVPVPGSIAKVINEYIE